MYKLVQAAHIIAARNAFTEAWILIYIHCKPEKKIEALTVLKKMLLTELIRPKLILMFDANLTWAKNHCLPDHQWMIKLCEVYNCETEVDVLNEWPAWVAIEAAPAPLDDNDEELTAELSTLLGVEDVEEEQMEQEQEQETHPTATTNTMDDR